jgi:hypothetical protein
VREREWVCVIIVRVCVGCRGARVTVMTVMMMMMMMMMMMTVMTVMTMMMMMMMMRMMMFVKVVIELRRLRERVCVCKCKYGAAAHRKCAVCLFAQSSFWRESITISYSIHSFFALARSFFRRSGFISPTQNLAAVHPSRTVIYDTHVFLFFHLLSLTLISLPLSLSLSLSICIFSFLAVCLSSSLLLLNLTMLTAGRSPSPLLH